MALAATSRRFTADEYHRMGDAGVLGPDERVELIDGEVVQVSPIGGRHARCVDRLNALSAPPVTGRAIVRVQGPLALSETSEPGPDLMLLAWQDDFYRAHPRPADVLLAIEVADSSLTFDRTVKIPLYGRAGVRETWLIDLVGNRVEVSRQPGTDGYRLTERLTAGQSVTVEALPDLTFEVGDLLD